jgi:hypothetical protein
MSPDSTLIDLGDMCGPSHHWNFLGYFADILMSCLFLYYGVSGEGIRFLPEVYSKTAGSAQHAL